MWPIFTDVLYKLLTLWIFIEPLWFKTLEMLIQVSQSIIEHLEIWFYCTALNLSMLKFVTFNLIHYFILSKPFWILILSSKTLPVPSRFMSSSIWMFIFSYKSVINGDKCYTEQDWEESLMLCHWKCLSWHFSINIFEYSSLIYCKSA